MACSDIQTLFALQNGIPLCTIALLTLKNTTVRACWEVAFIMSTDLPFSILI
jgi:hypothetical protein